MGERTLTPHKQYLAYIEQVKKFKELDKRHISRNLKNEDGSPYLHFDKELCELELQCREQYYGDAQDKHEYIRDYDHMFQIPFGYKQKHHRDDRQHSKFDGLHVYREERRRCVPLRMSGQIGRLAHKPLEPYEPIHKNVSEANKSMYRNTGTQLSPKPYANVGIDNCHNNPAPL